MATITEAGTASGLIKYTGSFTCYIPKSNVSLIRPANTERIAIECGGFYLELDFDDETQRDAAITTLLGYF